MNPRTSMSVPKTSVASMTTMQDVYTVCQNKPNAFAKGLEVMDKLYRDTTPNDFVKQLTPIVQIVLSNTESGEYAERLVDFTAQFLAATTTSSTTLTDDPDDPGGESSVLVQVLDAALEWSLFSLKVVRERCCTLVDKTLSSLKDEYAIDDNLVDRVKDAMMTRLKDRIGAVRAAAAGALSQLQEPSNSGCKIVEAFLFHLECDPCVEVRSAILSRIEPSTTTLAAIVARTGDVKDVIRRLALERIVDKVPVRYLSIRQRTAIIAKRLNDPAVTVRHVMTQKLIPAWLQQTKGSVVDFLRMLDVHGSTEAVEAFLGWYLTEHDPKQTVADFAGACLDADKLVPDDKLTIETLVYWRCLVLHLCASEAVDALVESVFPGTVVYCSYLIKHVCSFDEQWDALRQLEHRFMSRQLLMLAQAADIADNADRERLVETVRALLASRKVAPVLVQTLMKLLHRLFPSMEEMALEVTSVMSSLAASSALSQEPREEAGVAPPAVSVEVVKMREKLNTLCKDLSTCVERQQFAEAEEVKGKLLEAKQALREMEKSSTAALEEWGSVELDDATKLKIVTLVTEMLAVTPFTSMLPFLQMCLDDIVLPGILTVHPAVRKQATRALCLCCFLSKRTALKHMKLLFQIVLADTPQISAVALDGIIDLVLAFGVETFDSVLRNLFG